MSNELLLDNIKQAKKMGIAKLTTLLFSSINVLVYVFAFISNLDSVKSTILFIVAMAMSMYRFYRWAINNDQNKRLKDLAIRERELEIELQELEAQEKKNKKYSSIL